MVTVAKVTIQRRNDSKLIADATVTLTDNTCLSGVQVIQGVKGRFVGLPRTRNLTPPLRLDSQARRVIRNAVLDALDRADSEPHRP